VEHSFELIDGGGRLATGGAEVETARQPHGIVEVGEGIGAIYQNRGRTPEPGRFGVLGRCHLLVDHPVRVGPSPDESLLETAVRDPPVGAILEIHQTHLGHTTPDHQPIMNLPLQGKVKA